MTNIISKLTLRHLSENKKRTVVTVLGVAASTALITSMILGITSFFVFLGNLSGTIAGRWQLVSENMTAQQVQVLQDDKRVKSVGIIESKPEESGIMVDSDKSLRYRVSNTLQGNEEWFDIMVTSDYDGVLPKNSDEIAVEESFLKDNGLDLHVGDTLEYDQGYRYTKDLEGNITYLAGSWSAKEGFEVSSHNALKITAILHGNRPTGNFKILRGMNQGDYPEKMYGYVVVKKFDYKTANRLRELMKDYGLSDCRFNTEYLVSAFAFQGAGSGIEGMFRVMLIAFIIVVLASVVLIYNAFGMSLTERVRYLGMLASVGATKRQKRASVFFEAFILGLIGIPLGIVIGAIGCSITLRVLGKMILEADMIAGAEGIRGTMSLSAPVPALLAIVLLSGLTILLAAIVPALKASKIMPIEALKESNNIKLKANKLRGGRITRKFFGYEGELAVKNIKRNGRKGKVIILSIAISVIMFLTIDYFTTSFKKAYAYEIEYPFQLVATCSLSERDKLKEDLDGMEGIDAVYAGDLIEFSYKEDKNDPAWEMPNTDIRNPEFLEKGYEDVFDQSDQIYLALLDDDEFKRLLSENGISEKDYFSGELRGVILDNFYHEETDKKVFKDSILGQKLFYDDPEGTPPDIEIAGFVKYKKDDYIFNLTPKASVAVYVPESVYFEKMAAKVGEENLTCDFGIVCKNAGEVRDKVFEMLEAEGYTNYGCADLTETIATMNTVMVILKTALYGFTVLLSLIVVANIINTISTGVMLRRKEFAMLRSVGMSQSGFKKMMILETMLYGARALTIGVPGAVILSYLIYSSMQKKAFAFSINIVTYLMVILMVFGIVGLSMLLSSAKIKNDNIIETLKDDMV